MTLEQWKACIVNPGSMLDKCLKDWEAERTELLRFIENWSYCTRLGANKSYVTREFIEAFKEKGIP